MLSTITVKATRFVTMWNWKREGEAAGTKQIYGNEQWA